MDIKSLYTRKGEVFAAEVADGTETYPMFLEALGNNVILPALLRDGWKLTSLPLGLQKNGIALKDFPKKEWDPTMEQEQEMWDMMGEPVPMQERQMMLTVEAHTYSAFETLPSYHINTREEFIAYLDSLSNGVNDDDYLPLNCVVAPPARFTMAEVLAGTADKYLNAIAQRRCFSYVRYQRLVEFLLQNGMPANYTIKEFLATYFKWGLDGVQFAYSGSAKVMAFYNDETMDPPQRYADTVYALVIKQPGGRYKVLPPAGVEVNELRTRAQLKPLRGDVDDPSAFQLTVEEGQQLSDKAEGEAIIVRRFIPTTRWQWSCKCQEVEYNDPERMGTASTLAPYVHANAVSIRIGYQKKMGGFEFKTMSGTPMPPNYVGAQEKMVQTAYLMSLAKEFIQRRRKAVDASTVGALLENGCSQLSAAKYYMLATGYAFPPAERRQDSEMKQELEGEQVIPQITLEDIQKYVCGDIDELDTTVADVISDFLTGTANLDRINEGIEREESKNPTPVYMAFTAMVECLGMTPTDIKNAIDAWEQGNNLRLEKDGVYTELDGSIIDYLDGAYTRHIEEFRDEAAEGAPYYVWVEGAISELGDGTTKRHIGFYASVIDAEDLRVKGALKWLRNKYIDEVLAAAAPYKDVNSRQWGMVVERFLGPWEGPVTVTRDDPEMRYLYNGGATINFVAATALFQAMKQGIVRFPVPGKESQKIINLRALPAGYEEYGEFWERWKTFIKLQQPFYYCDTASYCDAMVSDYNAQYPWMFYTVNAVVTPTEVKARPGFDIKVYCADVAFRYSSYIDHWVGNNDQEAIRTRALPAVYHNVLMQNSISQMDSKYDLLRLVGLASGLVSYLNTCRDLSRQWKTEHPNEHLIGFTHPADVYENGIMPISEGTPARGDENVKGLPGWVYSNKVELIHYVPVERSQKVNDSPVKFFNGLTPEEFSMGVTDYVIPTTKGKRGVIVVRGNSIYIRRMDGHFHYSNPADVAVLDPNDYPVSHLCGRKYLIRTNRNKLYTVEV